MVMQDIDFNWNKLKEEDHSIPEPKPHSMMDAEDVKLVYWANNPRNQKISWRKNMAPYTAWIDLGDAKGMWRSAENRLYERIQAEYAMKHFGEGYKVMKSSARFEDGSPMLNLKFIHIFKGNYLQEVIIILDCQRVSSGSPYKVKGGQGWKFKDSVSIRQLL
jgi:hypothetical protein